MLYTIVAAFSAVGLGSIVAKLLRIRPNTGERGLLGLLSFGMVAGLTHFFFPISPFVQFVLLIVGLFACIALAAELGGVATIGLAVLAFALVFFRSPYPPYHDNGLYHIPTLLWNTQAPLTPGLVNLHGRFGFNSILFLIAPIVAQPAIGWITNALLASFTILACMERLRDHAKPEVNPSGFWFLVVAIAAFAINADLMRWLGILNADGFVAALIVYWVFLLFEYAEGIRRDTVPALILLLAVFAVMTKLGAAPTLVVAVGVMAFRASLRPSRRVFMVAGACLTIWVARSFLLSGCAAYPIKQTCIYSVPWAVGEQRATQEMDGIRSWARAPGRLDYEVVLSSWGWFGDWLKDARQTPPIPELRWALVLGLCALVFRLLARRKIDRVSIWIAAFLAGSIGFWFWGAPDPRFGVGYLASMGVLCAGFAAASVFPGRLHRVWAIGLLLAGVGIGTIRSAMTENWRDLPAIPPQPLPFSVRTVDGPWGIPVRAPDQSDDRCWDIPQPCMPWHYLDPRYLARVRWRGLPTHAAVAPAATGAATAFTTLPLRVNAGGSGYTDSLGRLWQSDIGAQQGWAMSTTAAISGTTTPEVYQTARYSGTGRLVYQFAIPNGEYTVTLKFAEIWHTTGGTGKRVFDIILNGTPVASHFDIFAAAGGGNKAFDLQYPVNVTNSQVNLTLAGVTREPLINGIEIAPVAGAKAARSAAGSPGGK